MLDVAIKVLHALSMTEAACIELGKRNAVRPLVAILNMKADVEDAAFVNGALTSALQVLERIAAAPGGRTIVGKQGGVSAVFAAMEAQSLKSGSEKFVAACEAAISAIVTLEDVRWNGGSRFLTPRVPAKIRSLIHSLTNKTVRTTLQVFKMLERLQGYPIPHISAGDKDLLIKVSADVSKLGLLLLCGDFASAISERRGVKTLISIMAAAEFAPDCREKATLITECIKALGRAISAGVKSSEVILNEARAVLQS